MLVLTRKTNESIRIGHNILVTVVAIQGGKVRLAFQCPPEVRVLRNELQTTEPESDRVSSNNRMQELKPI